MSISCARPILFTAVYGVVVLGGAGPSDAGVLRIGAYNTFNNPDNGVEDASYAQVFEAIGNETINGVTKRLDILALSETDGGSSARMPDIFNGLYGVDDYEVVTSSRDFFFDRTGFVYDTSTVELLGVSDMSVGFTHPALRAQFRPVGTDGGFDFYIYAVHLKSGTTSSDMARRAVEAALLRADADTLGDGRNILYVGDFNMQGSGEGAWTTITASGVGQAFDVAGTPGAWSDNPAFAHLHTQNARTAMLRRLDLQFASGELLDGAGLDYVDGSFRVFGNDGTHVLGDSIDTGAGASTSVLSALMSASDHLPIVADYAFPDAIPGDANRDGRVDAADLNILALTWQQTVTPSIGADFNGDGFVDATDLNAIALNWQKHEVKFDPPAAVSFSDALATTSIPEAATLSLWILGLTAVASRPRWQ